MELCGDRGFAGESACIRPKGHDGPHVYGHVGRASLDQDAMRYRQLRDGGNWPAVFEKAGAREPLRGESLDDVLDHLISNHGDSSGGVGALAGRATVDDDGLVIN